MNTASLNLLAITVCTVFILVSIIFKRFSNPVDRIPRTEFLDFSLDLSFIPSSCSLCFLPDLIYRFYENEIGIQLILYYTLVLTIFILISFSLSNLKRRYFFDPVINQHIRSFAVFSFIIFYVITFYVEINLGNNNFKENYIVIIFPSIIIFGVIFTSFYLKNRDKYFQVLFVAAQQKLLDKEYGECIEVYNECLNLTPKNNPIYLSALIGLAKAYQNLMNKKMAIQYLEMAEKNIQKENYPQNLKASFYAVKKEIVNTFL